MNKEIKDIQNQLQNNDPQKKMKKLNFFQQFDDTIVQMRKDKENKEKKPQFVIGAIPAANKKEEAAAVYTNEDVPDMTSPVISENR